MNFTATETGGTTPYLYAWQFGDGTTGGDLQNISHIFTTNGPFTAEVRVTDAAGASATAYLNLTVALNLTILGSWAAGASPLLVNFTSHAVGGSPTYAYAWEFGDGSRSALADPSHTYSTPGLYDAQATVTDSKGDSSTATWSVYVAEGGGTISVDLTGPSTAVPIATSFVVSAIASGGSGGYSYAWHNGGLSCLAAGALVERCLAYAQGSDAISLTIADAHGDSSTGQVTVEVGTTTGITHPGGSGSLVGPLGEPWSWIAIGAIVAVVIATLLVVRSRRPPRYRGPLANAGSQLPKDSYGLAHAGTPDSASDPGLL